VYSTMVEVYTHVVHSCSTKFSTHSNIRAIRSIRRIVNRERTLGLLSTDFIPREKAEVSKGQYSSYDKSSNVPEFGFSCVQYDVRGVHRGSCTSRSSTLSLI
jgi:hypothetical protein